MGASVGGVAGVGWVLEGGLNIPLSSTSICLKALTVPDIR